MSCSKQFDFQVFVAKNAKELGLASESFSDLPPTVVDLEEDSRKISRGHVFFATSGQGFDGTAFVQNALNNGAVCCVVPVHFDDPTVSERVLVRCHDVNQFYGRAIRHMFGCPDQYLDVLGVTGTNGKTSVVQTIQKIIRLCLRPKDGVATLGTLGAFVGDMRESELCNTTPLAKTFYGQLRKLVDQGVRRVVCEVSSHGAALGRVAGCHFGSVAFLNLTHDHLDFHRDMDHYFAAKARLFDHPFQAGWINTMTSWGRQLAQKVQGRQNVSFVSREGTNIRGVGPSNRRAVYGRPLTESFGRLMIPVGLENDHGRIQRVQVVVSPGLTLFPENIAMAVAMASDYVEIPPVLDLSSWRVLGRCDVLSGKNGQKVVIDYAHTPRGLLGVLRGLKNLYPNLSLTVVFGCGGDRDSHKRPQMGSIAARYAKTVVLTNDNPRTECPNQIVDQIRSGMKKAKPTVILDRVAAIRFALSGAGEDDIVVVAGKGHERDQIIGCQRIPCSDYEICKPFLVP